SLEYFAVGLPMGKLAAAFGVLPYSSVGYKVRSESTVSGFQSNHQFTGTGGINKAFVGFAYQLSEKFSLGAEAAYNFGRIETRSLQTIDGVQLGSREVNISDIGGFTFTAGMMYKTKFNEKLSF